MTEECDVISLMYKLLNQQGCELGRRILGKCRAQPVEFADRPVERAGRAERPKIGGRQTVSNRNAALFKGQGSRQFDVCQIHWLILSQGTLDAFGECLAGLRGVASHEFSQRGV